MTAKEKAKELVNRMMDGFIFIFNKEISKKHALIAVDEILKSFGTITGGQSFYVGYNAIEFYQEVKKEIEKL